MCRDPGTKNSRDLKDINSHPITPIFPFSACKGPRSSYVFALKRNIWLPGPFRPKKGQISDICALNRTTALVIIKEHNGMFIYSLDFQSGLWNLKKSLLSPSIDDGLTNIYICQQTATKKNDKYDNRTIKIIILNLIAPLL